MPRRKNSASRCMSYRSENDGAAAAGDEGRLIAGAVAGRHTRGNLTRDHRDAIYREGVTTSEAIGYLRVSTSGTVPQRLGLAAQRHEIEAFALCEGFAARSWNQDVQRGSGCAATATGACECAKGGEVGPMPADRLEARPPVAQRALHYRAHGA